MITREELLERLDNATEFQGHKEYCYNGVILMQDEGLFRIGVTHSKQDGGKKEWNEYDKICKLIGEDYIDRLLG